MNKAASINIAHLKIKIIINKKLGEIIIYLSITEIFITKKYTKSKGYSIKNKEKSYRLINLNDISLENN